MRGHSPQQAGVGTEGELVTGAVKINDWLLSITCTTNRLYIFFFLPTFPSWDIWSGGLGGQSGMSPLSCAFELFG